MGSLGNYTPRLKQAKAGRFAVRSAQVKKIEANQGEKSIRRPRCQDRRDTIAFAEREKQVSEKIHREHKDDSGGDTREDAPP
jgi:hypothetical protein